MKRKTLKLVACAAIMAVTLSVTACGGSKDTAPAAEVEETTEDVAEPEAEVEPEAEAEPEVEAEDESAEEAPAAGDTLESLLNDDAAKAQYEAVFDALAQDGMSVGIEAKGNELTVIIKIEDSSMVVDGIGEAIEAQLDQQAAAFETMAAQLDAAVGTTNECVVSFRYLDPDDNVLCEKSFQAQ